MTTSINMLLLFPSEEINFPPPQTQYIVTENDIQIITEDGNKLITE